MYIFNCENERERDSQAHVFTQCQKYVKRPRDMSTVCFIFCMSAFVYFCHKSFVMLLQRNDFFLFIFQHISYVCITLDHFTSSFNLPETHDITSIFCNFVYARKKNDGINDAQSKKYLNINEWYDSMWK